MWLLCISNEPTENYIRRTATSRRIKYLGINLSSDINDYNEKSHNTEEKSETKHIENRSTLIYFFYSTHQETKNSPTATGAV